MALSLGFFFLELGCMEPPSSLCIIFSAVLCCEREKKGLFDSLMSKALQHKGHTLFQI